MERMKAKTESEPERGFHLGILPLQCMGTHSKATCFSQRFALLFIFASIISQTAIVNWGRTNQSLPKATSLQVPVSPLMADRYIAGISGKVNVDLNDREGYRLEAITVGGRRYSSGNDFPTFTVLDSKGKQHSLQANAPIWQTEFQRDDAKTAVLYRAKGLVAQVVYIPDKDRLNIVVRLLEEGEWKLISVSGTLLTRTVSVGDDDHLVDGSGWLIFPDLPKAIERKWIANSDNLIGGATTAGFVAWREKDRIVFVKPLTFSHWLGWSAKPEGARTHFALRAGLYFRPSETKLFETKLCHEALALRIETIGDINGDGEVDWVDAGIAYRERYIKSHKRDCLRHRLRDAFRVYHSVHAYPSYEAAFAGLTDIDFADGIWWCKGVMKFAFEEDSESHPFTVELNPKLGDLAPYKQAMTEARQWTGIYYGHDYITLDAGDWPDEFIKRDPNNQPYRYFVGSGRYRTKFYKDNVRSVATGAVFRHYEQILQTCRLTRGDPIMLDTFSAFAREGYHPEFPATVELELQAKHRIAEFLHDKGLIVAGEGIVEGLQDVVDYGAYAMHPEWALKERIWIRREGIQRVPMLPVVFQGASYYGAGWYELRKPAPNWAIGLVYGVGYWDWLPQGPRYAWMRFARYYFNQNLIWAQVADAKVRDVEQKGSQFTIVYDNGAKLWADLEANRWVLEKDGVRYDGFTPFNNRGYMAVLAQGNFEITLPGEHQLEVSRHQPLREQILFECVPSEGRTVIRGCFGHIKWRIPILKVAPDGKEVTELYEAEPVLVLRRLK